MKKLLGGGLVVSAMAVAVIRAGPAHATMASIGEPDDWNPYNFRDELRYTGLYHEDVYNADELGKGICHLRHVGYTSNQLMDALIGPDPLNTVEHAVAIVRGAEFHFCSAYEHDSLDDPPRLPPPPRGLRVQAPLPPPPPPLAPYPDPGQTI